MCGLAARVKIGTGVDLREGRVEDVGKSARDARLEEDAAGERPGGVGP